MTEDLKTLSLDQIHKNPYQPRLTFSEEELTELAKSIQENGLIQPIIVRQSPVFGYELIAGERRFRAAKLAGLTHLPAIVKDMSDQESMTQAIIENLQRSDLNPIEEALAYQSLLTKLQMTHEDIAKSMGKSRPYISNSLRLLNLIPKGQEALITQTISPGHARLLLSLDQDQQKKWLDIIQQKDLTVRQLEKQLKLTQPATKAANLFAKDQEAALKKALGIPAKIQVNSKNQGKIILPFDNLEDFHNLFHKLVENVEN